MESPGTAVARRRRRAAPGHGHQRRHVGRNCSDEASTAELVEAIYVVGQYTMLSMVANVVEADDER